MNACAKESLERMDAACVNRNPTIMYLEKKKKKKKN